VKIDLIASILFPLLSGGPALAYPSLPSPSLVVTVAKPARSENPVCAVSQSLWPEGASGILVRIRVPNDSALKSVLLKTASDELPLEVTNSLPLVGEYETIIDAGKTNCATSGTLLLEVEGDLETKTATCSGILLPRAADCYE
jgi:hypothetical protein